MLFAGNLRPQHNIKDAVKRRSLRQLQMHAPAVLVLGKKIARSAHYGKSFMRIAERQGDRPDHVLALGNALGAVPPHVVGGLAHVEHGIEQ